MDFTPLLEKAKCTSFGDIQFRQVHALRLHIVFENRGIIPRIECRGNWMHNSQPLRYQRVSCASACPVDRFSFAGGVDGRVDARVPLDPASQAGF